MRAAGERSRLSLPEGLDALCEQVVYRHVFGSPGREVGGVLIGRLSGTDDLPHLTGAVEALHAHEGRADLTLTPDTWAHVHRQLERRNRPGERIVGWYHSHPGFGVFLSEHDCFVHRHFFSHPSQIALVIDPMRGTEGLFAWTDDRELELVCERPTPSAWKPRRDDTEEGRARALAARPVRLTAHLAAALIGILLGLGLHFAVLRDDPVAQDQTAEPVLGTDPSTRDAKGDQR